MLTEKGRSRIRRFITFSQLHLQWLRKKKWDIEQSASKIKDGQKKANLGEDYLKTCLRIDEVTNHIDRIYKML